MCQIIQTVTRYLLISIILIVSAGCDSEKSPEPLTIEFNHETVFVEVGGGSYPSNLVINASRAVPEDTTISLSCSNPTVLTVPGQVVILDGNSSVTVPLTGIMAQSSSSTLTASYEDQSPSVKVKVFDDSIVRSVVSISPDPLSTTINSIETLQVTLDFPAPTGGTVVDLSTTGSVGTIPASVTVPAGRLSTNFSFTAFSVETTGTIIAVLGGTNTSIYVEVNNP